ncbi:hypothetical protein [Embleya hyalina]|uniref:Chromosome partition protein Smc n=1 Tax=Embleya hyalina TaxID=516124 RepID=A0A401YYL2_9ACTN|nr:hypothetical protein [Embleya hyalina]GCD99697.1 chromosome partition protein Smc [Embleya hyalina]
MVEERPERDGIEPEAAAYGAAMEECFERCGASRREFAASIPTNASVVTRYFQGRRIAPAAFLTALAAFLAERGTPTTPQETERLDELRRAALEASTRPHNQAQAWRERAERLAHDKDELAALLREQQDRGDRERDETTRALNALGLDLAELREDLDQALADNTRLQAEKTTAEHERDELRARVDDLDRQLAAAAAYTRNLEHDLAEQRTAAERLSREVEVLRHQVGALVREAARDVVPVAARVPTPATRLAPTRPAVPAGPAERGRRAPRTASPGRTQKWRSNLAFVFWCVGVVCAGYLGAAALVGTWTPGNVAPSWVRHHGSIFQVPALSYLVANTFATIVGAVGEAKGLDKSVSTVLREYAAVLLVPALLLTGFLTLASYAVLALVAFPA